MVTEVVRSRLEPLTPERWISPRTTILSSVHRSPAGDQRQQSRGLERFPCPQDIVSSRSTRRRSSLAISMQLMSSFRRAPTIAMAWFRAGDINATAPALQMWRFVATIPSPPAASTPMRSWRPVLFDLPGREYRCRRQQSPGQFRFDLGSSVNIGGPITLDMAGTGQSLCTSRRIPGDLTVGGAINMGAGSLDLQPPATTP